MVPSPVMLNVLGIGGLAKFVKLRSAIAARDWKVAAAEGQVSGGRKDRNAWRAERFLDALAS